MRKIKIIVIMCCIILGTCVGCGVSQEDYDKLQTEKNELDEELEASRQQLETLKQDYEKTKKELLDEKTQKLDEDRKHSFARAWAATYFGEDCLVLIDGEKYLQLVSQEPYSATLEGVQTVYKQCLNSMSGLGVYVDQIKYNKIGLKFQQTNGEELIEFVLRRENGTYVLDSISGNLVQVPILLAVLEKY